MKKIITTADPNFSVFESAYRTFFILATVSSLYYMALWTAFYTLRLNLNFKTVSPTMWHAHEMLFGYTAAVFAGFLLTIEKYRFGMLISKKSALILLLALWILARVFISLTLFTNISWNIGAAFDCLFILILGARVLYPIITGKDKEKTGPAAHLALMAVGNVVFYLGVFGVLHDGQRLGVYSALFLVVSMILLMGRMMIPLFIRNGLDFSFMPRNWRVIDILSLVFFVLFFVLELFFARGKLVSVTSGILALIYTVRLYGWYSNGIWKRPMLWVLYAAYIWIVIGFGLKFLSLHLNIPELPALHSFTYGGIGLITLGFMSRVTLGHTGRSVFTPPGAVSWIFTILLAGAIVRVFFPVFGGGHYGLWIAVSQILWILSFLIFAAVFLPMLWRPRIEINGKIST
ncbi:MAG TPA: NnrS family protein [Thermodesulfobacteriota bacterium]|nr:NnrS family protein [Thermodesulfobacteriota bacterium]